MNSPLSLYVHIPFCHHICPYCAFTKSLWNQNDENAYIKSIQKEAKATPELIGKRPIKSLFLGGGTPTSLTLINLDSLLSTLFSTFNFQENYEATIEINPETVTIDLLDLLSSHNINRLSIGVQSFNDQQLKYLGRQHDASTIHTALTMIKAHPVNWNINLDLIFGAPHSSVDSTLYSLNTVLEYVPNHISTYALTIEPGTPFAINKVRPVPDDQELEQFKAIIQTLNQHGYDHYEVSAFAKPGFQSVHNLSYWQYSDFIGLGPSGHSFINNKRSTQTKSLKDYIKDPRPPLLRKSIPELSEKELKQEFIFSQLRLIKGLNLDTYHSRFHSSCLIDFEVPIQELVQNKLLNIENKFLKTTKKGVYLLNELLLQFLD